MAGRQCNVFSPNLILNMQSSLIKVSCGKFSTFPISCTVLFSSLKRKLISFYLVILFNTYRIKYYSKYTIQPSIKLIGLFQIIKSSPKLYFTCTLQDVLSFQTSQLSTQLSSKITAERQFYFYNSTASQLTPYVFESEAIKSEGNLRPISTLSLDWLIGKFLTGADTLQSSKKRYLVGRVEQILEWLKEISIGNLVVRSQSNAQESGIRMTGLDSVSIASSVSESIRRNNIIIIMKVKVGQIVQIVFQNKALLMFDHFEQQRVIKEFIISNKMSQEEHQNQHEQIDQELDDLADLELFHTSSLRDPEDPPLEPLAQETYQLKRIYGLDNAQNYNQYELIGQLGRGAFGQVLRVKAGTQQYAMKINNTKGLQKQRFFAADGQFASCLDVLKNQLNILKRLKHKNIARCFEIIYGSDRICTINQLGTLGQIMDWRELDDSYKRNNKVVQYIGSKYKTNNLGDITRLIFIQVCEAVRYLHDHNITNRDIKVDNILCRETQGIGDQILVVDFTTVRYKYNDDISYFPTGTPGFRGPQHQFASSQGYSCKATDVWAVGIAMWLFFHQKLPFQGQTQLQRDINAKNVELWFAEDCPQVVVEAIKKMTRKQWKDRITISQALDILQKGN